MKTSWLMSFNKGESKGTRFKDLPEWAQQYLQDLREYHSVQLEAFGESTRKWANYSMTGILHQRGYYRLAGATHCAAIRIGYKHNQTQYKFIFVADPKPVPIGTVVSQIKGKACIGQLYAYGE